MLAGQISDNSGAVLLDGKPQADWLLANCGYDADWLKTFHDKRINAPNPNRKSRKNNLDYDKRRYKKRNCIKTMFSHLKDWQRAAIRYGRCPKSYFPTSSVTETTSFWL